MKGIFTAGAIATATAVVATATYIGYKNRDTFYDERLGGFYLKSMITNSLDESIVTKKNKLVKGLEYPLESVILIPVEKDTNNLIMSLGKRKEKTPEWTFVGGKAKSWKRGEDKMVDYSDNRFVTEDNCEDIVFENPKECLIREVVEELTGEKYNNKSCNFDWLINRISNESTWKFIKTTKDSPTYIGLCRIILSTKEIAVLNSNINDYLNREQIYFASKEWVVEEFETDGKRRNRLKINLKDDKYAVRKFNSVLFLDYWSDLSELVTR